MHGSATTAGAASGDGRPTEALGLRELFDLNAYWLAINLLWGALGISLLPVLMVELVCGGDKACPNPTSILPGVTVGKGAAEAIIINLGVIIAILVQPTVAALSDHTSSRLGRRKPYIIVGTLLDMVFLLGFYLAGRGSGSSSSTACSSSARTSPRDRSRATCPISCRRSRSGSRAG